MSEIICNCESFALLFAQVSDSNIPAVMKDRPDSSADAPSQERARSVIRQIDSHVLMQGKDQIEILHGNQIYHLRVTRQGKLILTK